MVSVTRGIYNTLFRKNYFMLGTVFAAAFGFEMLYEKTTDSLWDSMNRGRQWKDIRAKYVEGGDDDE